jgi:hypothetical protein
VRKLSMTLLALAALPVAARTAHAQGDTGGPMVSDSRPAPMTVGIGLGAEAGVAGTVFTPTVGSVRIVLAPNLQLEPSLSINHHSESGEGGGASKDIKKVDTILVGAGVRFALASRGPVDLQALGSLVFAHTGTDNEDVNSTFVTQNRVGLEWGLALSYYFAHVWSLSMDATNPLFSYTKQGQDQTNAGVTTSASTSAIDFGLNFLPRVRLMLHLFF